MLGSPVCSPRAAVWSVWTYGAAGRPARPYEAAWSRSACAAAPLRWPVRQLLLSRADQAGVELHHLLEVLQRHVLVRAVDHLDVPEAELDRLEAVDVLGDGGEEAAVGAGGDQAGGDRRGGGPARRGRPHPPTPRNWRRQPRRVRPGGGPRPG